MKVLLINGSPHKHGCTYTALSEVAKTLELHHIETEIAWIKSAPIRSCQACSGCSKSGKNRCIYEDIVNEFIEKAETADGFIWGTPVYYAGANGAVISLLDRMFCAASSVMAYKPAAALSSARRAGTITAIDQINKYFQYNNMPLVSSNYWLMVHGNSPEEVKQDKEGLQTMRLLGENIAWMLQCIEAGRSQGIPLPAGEKKIKTNFISSFE